MQTAQAEGAESDPTGATIEPFREESFIVVKPNAQILEEALESGDHVWRFKEADVGATILGKLLQ